MKPTAQRFFFLIFFVRILKFDGVHFAVVNQPASVRAALAFVLLVPETISLHLPQHRLRLPSHATLSERRLVRVVPRTLLTHPLVHVYPAVRDKTPVRRGCRRKKRRLDDEKKKGRFASS